MIRSLDVLTRLSETLLNAKHTATEHLPSGVEVVQKLTREEQSKLAQYLLKIEGKLLEAMSEQELNVGQKYWAQLEKSSDGAVKISNLTLKPEQLQPNAMPQTTIVELEKFVGIVQEFIEQSLKPSDEKALTSSPQQAVTDEETPKVQESTQGALHDEIQSPNTPQKLYTPVEKLQILPINQKTILQPQKELNAAPQQANVQSTTQKDDLTQKIPQPMQQPQMQSSEKTPLTPAQNQKLLQTASAQSLSDKPQPTTTERQGQEPRRSSEKNPSISVQTQLDMSQIKTANEGSPKSVVQAKAQSENLSGTLGAHAIFNKPQLAVQPIIQKDDAAKQEKLPQQIANIPTPKSDASDTLSRTIVGTRTPTISVKPQQDAQPPIQKGDVVKQEKFAKKEPQQEVRSEVSAVAKAQELQPPTTPHTSSQSQSARAFLQHIAFSQEQKTRPQQGVEPAQQQPKEPIQQATQKTQGGITAPIPTDTVAKQEATHTTQSEPISLLLNVVVGDSPFLAQTIVQNSEDTVLQAILNLAFTTSESEGSPVVNDETDETKKSQTQKSHEQKEELPEIVQKQVAHKLLSSTPEEEKKAASIQAEERPGTSESTKSSPLTEIKTALLEDLANARTKQEFTQLASTALAFSKGIVSVGVKDKDGSSGLVQFRAKRPGFKMQTVEFYSAFEHIGPVAGEITLAGDETYLSLIVHFESSFKFLQNELKNLEFFDPKNISVRQDTPRPLLGGAALFNALG